ncbi:CDP-diacylglycerol--glycerol-3-phosphate 3-phosphatidyltransferase [Mesomycoplasma molare]|uniref:CDP-diacylglycerol--glycerol-3-phosphate 3-phosphatidyltransferase n=1 Tax=Mesomycoplasma molare TaxID=171288 RepID=A0ABY5TXX4_9BACT|nr:CDP-diacylglycerol--glycerol-3-phosphate 3-phosphatidyltransferase [Mesomycoplasma molare]UWD34421.1 CDP-diacylglycerol--glycerol-3-phosphate 3-phosphatidyltransferase [Mesomycoplasma molare]
MKNKNLPNYLTIIRIILLVPFLILLTIFFNLSNGDFSVKNKNYFLLLIATFIFLVAMITDFLDGYLARKYNNVTNFGKLFDPIADKVITSTAIIFLTLFNFTSVWVVVIFIVRDVVVDGCRNLAAKNNLKIHASIWGKLKTLTQSFAIPILFFLGPIFYNSQNWNWIFWLLNTPLLISLFLSIYSGFLYFWDIKKLIKLK